ncbi:MAG: hypothetical protein K9H25_11195 [Rhodospirillum sp.]|nr:hypothetical protein [Rhodospirillum sp.]MCF8489502.1 hypothetical protein [Rhodospirillum sp.]
MIEKTVSTADLEQIYDHLAEAIDRAGLDKDRLFLAKLSLALSTMVADPARVAQAIEASLRDL